MILKFKEKHKTIHFKVISFSKFERDVKQLYSFKPQPFFPIFLKIRKNLFLFQEILRNVVRDSVKSYK